MCMREGVRDRAGNNSKYVSIYLERGGDLLLPPPPRQKKTVLDMTLNHLMAGAFRNV